MGYGYTGRGHNYYGSMDVLAPNAFVLKWGAGAQDPKKYVSNSWKAANAASAAAVITSHLVLSYPPSENFPTRIHMAFFIVAPFASAGEH
jgi:hypothetical protein